MPVGETIGSKLIKNIHTITSRLFHMKQPGCYYQPMLPLSKKQCSTNTSILCLISVSVNTVYRSFIDIYDKYLSRSKITAHIKFRGQSFIHPTGREIIVSDNTLPFPYYNQIKSITLSKYHKNKRLWRKRKSKNCSSNSKLSPTNTKA